MRNCKERIILNANRHAHPICKRMDYTVRNCKEQIILNAKRHAHLKLLHRFRGYSQSLCTLIFFLHMAAVLNIFNLNLKTAKTHTWHIPEMMPAHQNPSVKHICTLCFVVVFFCFFFFWGGGGGLMPKDSHFSSFLLLSVRSQRDQSAPVIL